MRGSNIKLFEKLEELITRTDLNERDRMIACGDLFLRYAPRSFDGWPSVLRDTADFIERMPKQIELSHRAISAILEEMVLSMERVPAASVLQRRVKRRVSKTVSR